MKNVTFGLLHQWLTDMGMTVSANTLRNWLKKGKVYLDKLVESLKEVALEKDSIVNCDETWCKVRKYDHYKKHLGTCEQGRACGYLLLRQWFPWT